MGRMVLLKNVLYHFWIVLVGWHSQWHIREFSMRRRERWQVHHFTNFAVLRMSRKGKTSHFHPCVAVITRNQKVWRSCENVSTIATTNDVPKSRKKQLNQIKSVSKSPFSFYIENFLFDLECFYLENVFITILSAQIIL